MAQMLLTPVSARRWTPQACSPPASTCPRWKREESLQLHPESFCHRPLPRCGATSRTSRARTRWSRCRWRRLVNRETTQTCQEVSSKARGQKTPRKLISIRWNTKYQLQYAFFMVRWAYTLYVQAVWIICISKKFCNNFYSLLLYIECWFLNIFSKHQCFVNVKNPENRKREASTRNFLKHEIFLCFETLKL